MFLIPPGKRRNKFWNVRFQSADGSYREISTRQTDKRAASRAAPEIIQRVNAAAKPRGHPQTFREVADVYATARNVGKDTKRYLGALNNSALGNMRIDAVRPADILAAASTLYPRCTNETKNRQALVPAAAVLHFAAEQDWCQYRKVKKLPEKEPAMRRVSAGDMQRLIAAADGPLQKLLILLYGQGWRISEALALRREHVDFQHGTLRVWVSKVGKWKTVLMAPEVHIALASGEWYGPDKHAFPWSSSSSVRRPLRQLCARVGVRFTPHMARHAFGSELGESGAGPKDMLSLGTWTNAQSVLRYQHPGREHLRALLRGRGNSKQKVG